MELASAAVSNLRCDLALPEKKIQYLMNFCDEMLSTYQRFAMGLVADFLDSNDMQNNLSSVTLINDLEVTNIFEDVGSPAVNLSYLSWKIGRKVPDPMEIELGVRKTTRTIRYRARKNRRQKFHSVKKVSIIRDRMHYIPVKDTLALIFSNAAAREMVLHEQQSDDDNIRGFKDGTLFTTTEFCKNHPFGLRLSIHIDDVEYCNPLGSRRGKHKLTVITFKIQNFDSKINSGLDRVYVALLVPSKCVKKYGYEKILQPLLQDLMVLQSETGFSIKINENESFTLRSTLVHVLGDTAAFHEIFELMPAQSAVFCRACYITRNSMHAGNFGVHVPLRTPESVNNDILALQNGSTTPARCGIVKAPVLHCLKYFHFAENLSFDPMHDVLEGVVSMILKKTLNHFVNIKKLISDNDLNDRIQNFDYGVAEIKDKPSGNFTAKSLKSKGNSLSQSASQSWLLLRAFNFIFSDIIDNDFVEIVSYLLKITFYAFSNFLTSDMINDLELTIDNLYRCFKLCFPGVNPINKVHHLSHYPTLIRRSGPIVNMSCLQFEGKYKELKSLTKTCCNFKKSAHSLSKRINLKQTKSIINHEYSVDKLSIKSAAITQKESLECALLLFDLPNDVESINCMSINGVIIRPGIVVKYKTFDGQNYGIINAIIRANDNCICIIQVLKVVELCYSLLSYKTEITNQMIRTSVNNIFTKKSYSLWRLHNSTDDYLYISLKYND